MKMIKLKVLGVGFEEGRDFIYLSGLMDERQLVRIEIFGKYVPEWIMRAIINPKDDKIEYCKYPLKMRAEQGFQLKEIELVDQKDSRIIAKATWINGEQIEKEFPYGEHAVFLALIKGIPIYADQLVFRELILSEVEANHAKKGMIYYHLDPSQI